MLHAPKGTDGRRSAISTPRSTAEARGGLKRAIGDLAERVFEARDEERQMIAHEVHDEIGPHLFALRASAAVLAKNVGDDPAASAIEAQVEALQRWNRRFLADPRPAVLEELGLAEAFEALVVNWRRALGWPSSRTRIDVSLRFETPVVEPGLSNAGLGGFVVRVADGGRGLEDPPAPDDGTGPAGARPDRSVRSDPLDGGATPARNGLRPSTSSSFPRFSGRFARDGFRVNAVESLRGRDAREDTYACSV